MPDGSNQPWAGLSHWRRSGFGILVARIGGSSSGDFTMADASEPTRHDSAELTRRNPPDSNRPADFNRNSTYELTARASTNATTAPFASR